MLRILRRSSAFVVGAVMSLALACSVGSNKDEDEDSDQFREDTLTCEEALAHLQDCCPDFDTTAVACRYYFKSTSGCGDSTESREEPAFTLQESRCIRNKSCAELRESFDYAVGGRTNVCKRAQAAIQYIDRKSTSSGGESTGSVHQTHPPVCP
jgi:hypothetical protein